MKSYYGTFNLSIYLGKITGKEFEVIYNEYAKSSGRRPVASTILPTGLVNQEGKSLHECWLFYELKEEDNRLINKETGKVESKKQIKMEM